MLFTTLLSPLFLATVALAAVRTSPPSGCKAVNKSPSSGQYSTISAAVASLSTSSTSAQCIFIYPGTYSEQVYIPKLASALTLYGSSTNTITYGANTVTITQGRSQDNVANNDLTATLRAHTPNLKVYNINLVNTRGSGSQALAVSAQADKQGYYACSFQGYQDTILANEGNQVYLRSYISGATDFIFGQRARAWFGRCDIRIKGKGYITANGRDSESNVSYYVISDSDVKVADGLSLADGSTYLGRPWRSYSRVVFQRTGLSKVVNSAGWVKWSDATPNTGNVFYREFGNSGTGASGTRASFSQKLSAPVEMSAILGSGFASWVDGTYL